MLKCLIVVGVWVAVAYGDECGSCIEIPKHYQELGCKAIKEKESDCCPQRFECPNFVELDKSKCNFDGKSYAPGEVISKDTHNLPTCTVKCTCKQSENIVAFDCDFDNCPEAAEEPKPECRNQYTLDSCCSVKSVCDAEEIKSLHTCWYDGKDYHGGNLIYPEKESCYKCLCDEKFDNSTAIGKNPNCHPVDCGIQVHGMNNFQAGCVPVYFDDNYCCPVEFKCPKDTDAIIAGKGKSAAESAPELTCKFGALTLGYNEVIKTEDKCLDCACDHPPLVKCTRKITTKECH